MKVLIIKGSTQYNTIRIKLNLMKLKIFFPEYPWRFANSTTDSNVIKWLYLPDFYTRPSSKFLRCGLWLCILSLYLNLWDVFHYSNQVSDLWLNRKDEIFNRSVLCLPFFLSLRFILCYRWLYAAAVCVIAAAGVWWGKYGSSPSNSWRKCWDLPRSGCCFV